MIVKPGIAIGLGPLGDDLTAACGSLWRDHWLRTTYYIVDPTSRLWVKVLRGLTVVAGANRGLLQENWSRTSELIYIPWPVPQTFYWSGGSRISKPDYLRSRPFPNAKKIDPFMGSTRYSCSFQSNSMNDIRPAASIFLRYLFGTCQSM